ncbi:MAG: serine dehydratase beta chain, partial [Rhodospirillaceae bacterium]
MFLSVFDLFKIGIGPSSSHTVGPMLAAGRFLTALAVAGHMAQVGRLACRLYGSLAFTVKGHGTDTAVVLGLLGAKPDTVDPDAVPGLVAGVRAGGLLVPAGGPAVAFDRETDIVFDYGPALPGHANGLRFAAEDERGRELMSRTYYSVGGGFVVDDDELNNYAQNGAGVALK